MITFPNIFANLSGNIPASTLDANFTYTGTLPSQATTITAGGHALTGTETILINAGTTPFSCTLTQFASGVGVGTAASLANSHVISATGDVSWASAPFNGTADVSGVATIVAASTTQAGKIQIASPAQVAAGTSNSVAITPQSMAGNSSIGGAGYYEFPGGLIIQWGTSTTGGTFNSGTVTFPVAFPNNVFSITATVESSGTNGYLVQTSSWSSTGFVNTGYQVASPGAVSVTFAWVAIGN
jgi:hypothetical protein